MNGIFGTSEIALGLYRTLGESVRDKLVCHKGVQHYQSVFAYSQTPAKRRLCG